MNPEIQSLLLDLNRRFYQTYARSFAETRRRIQPGVRQVLGQLPAQINWLDLGCGSGALAAEWARSGRRGAYTGLDVSAGLLDEARRAAEALPPAPQREITFLQADLAAPGWDAPLGAGGFDLVTAFAVLHHLPGADLRAAVLRQATARLPFGGGRFIHSEWQFHHSPRLLARVLPWETIGLSAAGVDPGDTLLDWRAPETAQPDLSAPALRYVHRFTPAELTALAQACHMTIVEEFESDGEGGRLGWYQVWEK